MTTITAATAITTKEAADALVSTLEAAIKSAARVAGVHWRIDRYDSEVYLSAIYDADSALTDEPWALIGDIPHPSKSGISESVVPAGYTSVANWVRYDLDLDEEDA